MLIQVCDKYLMNSFISMKITETRWNYFACEKARLDNWTLALPQLSSSSDFR